MAGGGQSLAHWALPFISLLSPPENPHYLVIYDYRDTGRSSRYTPKTTALGSEGGLPATPYTIPDLACDCLFLLSHLSVASVHLVGFSIGGGLAYLLASGELSSHLEAQGAQLPAPMPNIKINSITLISCTPCGPSPRPEDSLPVMCPTLATKLPPPVPSSWTNKEEVVKFLVDFDTLCSDPQTAISSEEQDVIRSRAETIFDRATAAEKDGNSGGVASMFNVAGAAHKPWPRKVLPLIRCPAVVIHGREDGVVKLEHGEALANEIPGAKLVVVEGMGHEIPVREWGRISKEVLEVVAKGEKE